MRENVKYKLIENYIIEKIQSGDLKPGDQIETEKQLQERFGIGHITVNKALNNLANRGYINRTAGKGSFVNNKMIIKSQQDLTSFTEDIQNLGMTPGSKLIKYEIIKAKEKPEAMKYLELKPDDLIHYFIRVRTANDVPIAVSYTCISAKILPAIDIRGLESSFKEYLKSIDFKANVSAII